MNNESKNKEIEIFDPSSVIIKKDEASVKVEKIENGDKDISEIKLDIPLNIEIKEDNVDK